MKHGNWTIGLAMVLVLVTGLQADVLNMGGTRNTDGTWTGLASLETVPVGNLGNAADTRYNGISVGSVGYTYNIGKYDVTAGQYCEFLNAVAKTDTYGLYNAGMSPTTAMGPHIQRTGSSGNYSYSLASDWANRPVNYVSFWNSCRFANWLQNGQPTGAQGPGTTEDGAYTLTTDGMNNNTIVRNTNWNWAVTSENEWYKAAYYDPNKPGGAGYWDYPTKSNTVPSNTLSSTGTNNANYCWENEDEPYLHYTIGDPYLRTEVGAFASSPGPYGTFDQCGNVWQWNEALLSNSSRRGLRGGSFELGYISDLHASHYNTSMMPSNYIYDTGFRVVQVPEPASIAILALGGLAILLRKS